MHDKQSTITISDSFAKLHDLLYVKSLIVKFGFKTAEVKVFVAEGLKNLDVGISRDVIDKLTIPVDNNFNITIDKNELIIGPFIGVFMASKNATLTKKLRSINSFVKKYNKLNGVIIAFSLEGVNKNNLTISGYIFNPALNIWEWGTFPYPSSIFKRSSFNREWREHFGSLYGNKIFNSNSFDKWEMYQRLNQFNDLKQYLSPTILYNDSFSAFEFLNKYKNIYIKPIDGKQGKGIFNVVKDNGSIAVKTRMNGENVSYNFTKKEEFSSFVAKELKKERYIIQQTLDIQKDSKSIDFRIGMDKNQKGEWETTTFLSRVSGDDSIVSNRAVSGGTINEIKDVLNNIYKMSDNEVNEFENEFKSVALKASKKLELTGLSLGKLAFDMAIDDKNKMWIIEINSRYPDDSLVISLGRRRDYYETRLLNMLYGKYLSGFNESESDIVYRMNSFKELLQENIDGEVRIYIGVFKKKRQAFNEYLNDVISNTSMNSHLLYNKEKAKFELTLKGNLIEVYNMIKKIKSNDNFNTIIGIVKL